MAKWVYEMSPKGRLGPLLGRIGGERMHGPRGAVSGACGTRAHSRHPKREWCGGKSGFWI